MTTVIADISTSLDGFVTGPNAGPGNGLGDGGDAIHGWVFGGDPVDQAVLQRSMDQSGAVVMGRNLFDVIDAPDGWNDEMNYGADAEGERPPFVVVTHAPPASVRLHFDFSFVDGVAEAVEAARAVAGDKDVFIMGGGQVVRQAVDLGVADELRIHLSPVLLGGGTPLFDGASRRELVQRSVEVSAFATHLTYDVR